MASSKRERELARMRAERQAARRAAAAARRRQRNAIIASVVAVALVAAGAIALAASLAGDSEDDLNAANPTPSASSQASLPPGTCKYEKTQDKPAKEGLKLPPETEVETKQPFEAIMKTNQGEIRFDLLTAEAPCTVNNMRSLAHFLYYDNTECHRLTNQGIFVLQCGDPTGTGSGGPGYQFADENLDGATYKRGTIAMANAGQGTNGSQFFLVYKDSELPPQYTPFGRITQGLEILDKIAAAGSEPAGDGKPKTKTTITTLRTKAKAA